MKIWEISKLTKTTNSAQNETIEIHNVCVLGFGCFAKLKIKPEQVKQLTVNHTEQTINFEPVLHGEMWGPLRDLNLFNHVGIDPIARTLSWPNGADFDPETLRNWPEYCDELANRAQAWDKVFA